MTKLEYKPVGGGSYATLMDVTLGGVLTEWQPDAVVNSVQRENLAAAVGQLNNSYRQPLGNISTKISMALSITSANETAAAAYALATVTALLGSKCHYKATFGSTILYYPNGVCNRLKSHFQGATIELQMEVETDQVTASAV